MPFAALACAPRLTMEQFELPKHLGLLVLAGVLLAGGAVPGPRTQPALLAWMAAVAASAVGASAPSAAWLGDYENLEGVLTWACYAVLFLAGAGLDHGQARRFRTAVVAAACLGAAYALLQQAGADPFRGERFRHVRAFAGNPDFLAQQMAMAIPLLLARGAGGVPTLGPVGVFTCSAGGVFTVGAVGVFTLVLGLTASRGGLLGGIAGCVVALAPLPRTRPADAGRRWLGAAAAGAAGLLVAELLLPADLSLHGRLEDLAAGHGLARTRGIMWEGVARAARERPLLGLGPDGLGAAFLRTAPPGWADLEGLGTTARKAHDEPLHVLAIAGVAGLGAWAWLLAVAFRRPERDPAAVAALCAALIHNLVGFSTAATAPVVWVLLGRLSSCKPEQDTPGVPVGTSGVSAYAETPKRAILVALGLMLAVFGAFRFSADAWAYRGNEAARAGAPGRATDAFLVAARLAPWEATYLVRAASGLEQSGRPSDALPLYERAAAFSPADGIRLGHVGRVSFALASAARNRGARDEAYATLLKAVALAPSQPSLYGAAIMAAQQLGNRADVDRLVADLRAREPGWAQKMLGR
ncbi:MAG: O-antigen ligase family protein [Candidatus Coatesbacteria bacterium]